MPPDNTRMYTAGLAVLGHALPNLVQLSVHGADRDSERQLEALSLLFDPDMFRSLALLVVPLGWICASVDGPSASISSLPGTSQELLADLRRVRPALLVKWQSRSLDLVELRRKAWIDASTPTPHDCLFKEWRGAHVAM